MTQDYTKANSNRLRAVTIAGEIANIIQRIQLNPQLPQMQTAGLGFGTATTRSGDCGLQFTPTTVSLTIPTNDTGSVAASTVVTSSVAQNVTFSTSWFGTVDACLGTPTITPSTYSFTVGGSVTLLIFVPYTNCVTTGIQALLTVSATTDGGCVTYMGGAPGAAGGTGGVTTSNVATFVFEVTCNANPPYTTCTPSNPAFSSMASGNSVQPNCTSWGGGLPGCPWTSPGYVGPSCTYPTQLRSVNGFAGTITITGAVNNTPRTLAAGQTIYVGDFTFGNTLIDNLARTTGKCCEVLGQAASATATCGSISKTVVALDGVCYYYC